jgi:hypothetical protein
VNLPPYAANSDVAKVENDLTSRFNLPFNKPYARSEAANKVQYFAKSPFSHQPHL